MKTFYRTTMVPLQKIQKKCKSIRACLKIKFESTIGIRLTHLN